MNSLETDAWIYVTGEHFFYLGSQDPLINFPCCCQEMTFGRAYSTKTDMWSLGCVVYEILTLG